MYFCRPTFWTAKIAFCRRTFRSKLLKYIIASPSIVVSTLEVFEHQHFYFFTVRISDLLLVTTKIDIGTFPVPLNDQYTPLANGHEQYSNCNGKLMHFVTPANT